jgi:leucyl aminopeptidase
MTMRIQIESGGAADVKADTVVIPITRRGETPSELPRGLSGLDRRMGGRLGDAIATGDFQAGEGDRLAIYGPRDGDLVRVILLGVGEADSIDDARLRALGGRVGRETNREGSGRVVLVVPAGPGLGPEGSVAQLTEGALLGRYRFDRYKSSNGKSRKRPTLRIVYTRKARSLAALRAAAKRAATIAECQIKARDLSNEPPNSLYPETLARDARRMAREVGLKCQVLGVPEMERRGMGAILAVGQGSERPPRMIVLEHGATAARKRRGTLAMIGKGVTFDSGGLSIKPAANMPEMKHDMSGAAAVFGAMRAIALLDLPIHVVGILAAAENMPSHKAYRPSDIIESASGQTIEIVNTDAEGRLVMADALDLAVKSCSPDAMIDIATLTGAAMLAFGPWATAGLGNDDALLEELRAAGDATGETVWPMPLLEAHTKAMRSQVADWKNSGGRDAGISTAGAFLQGFVGETPWVHLDIAGSGMTATQTPLHIGGGTGVGVRLLTEWVQSRCA